MVRSFNVKKLRHSSTRSEHCNYASPNGHATTSTLLLAVLIFLSSAAARAESINANLCKASSRNAAERTLSSAETRELLKYVEGLKKGSYSFNWTISGHEAAKQLGFGRRFAATHGQAVAEVRARMARKSSVHIDEIIEYFDLILREEQSIDRLVSDGDRHFLAVLYLRALQEGECLFPYVLRDTPTAQGMMNHLARAYPELKKRFMSEPFARIYDATVAYGRNQIKQNGSVSIYRLIEEMRRAIVQSAAPNVATAPSISSEPRSITPAAPQDKEPQTKSTGSGFFCHPGWAPAHERTCYRRLQNYLCQKQWRASRRSTSYRG